MPPGGTSSLEKRHQAAHVALVLPSLVADNSRADEPVLAVRDGLDPSQRPVPVGRGLGWRVEGDDDVVLLECRNLAAPFLLLVEERPDFGAEADPEEAQGLGVLLPELDKLAIRRQRAADSRGPTAPKEMGRSQGLGVLQVVGEHAERSSVHHLFSHNQAGVEALIVEAEASANQNLVEGPLRNFDEGLDEPPPI